MLMVNTSSTTRLISIRIRLPVIVYTYIYFIVYNILSNILRVSNLIGKGFSCHETRCRIEAGLTRKFVVYAIISIYR